MKEVLIQSGPHQLGEINGLSFTWKLSNTGIPYCKLINKLNLNIMTYNEICTYETPPLSFTNEEQ